MRIERITAVQGNDIGAAEVAGENSGLPLRVREVLDRRASVSEFFAVALQRLFHLCQIDPAFFAIDGADQEPVRSSLDDLDSLLTSIEDDDSRLVGLADKIARQSRSLMETHEEFESEFNRLATDRETADDKLLQLVREYDVARLRPRNELLHSQDELRAAVPADAWPDVLEILNRKQRARAPGRAQGA